MKKNKNSKMTVGWCEWVSLPTLGLPALKAKVDTGAKTSALHAFNIEPFYRRRKNFVRFTICPVQANNDVWIRCTSEIIDERYVLSSNGHKELRYVISTTLFLGEKKWDIEVTLSDRDPLRFRMLLGREALKKCVIHPSRTYCQGRIDKQELYDRYGLLGYEFYGDD